MYKVFRLIKQLKDGPANLSFSASSLCLFCKNLKKNKQINYSAKTYRGGEW